MSDIMKIKQLKEEGNVKVFQPSSEQKEISFFSF